VGMSVGLLFSLSDVLCVALGLIWWDAGFHKPWLQFLPNFTWLKVFTGWIPISGAA